MAKKVTCFYCTRNDAELGLIMRFGKFWFHKCCARWFDEERARENLRAEQDRVFRKLKQEEHRAGRRGGRAGAMGGENGRVLRSKRGL